MKRRTREQVAEELADAALKICAHDTDRTVDIEAEHAFQQLVPKFLEII